MKEQLLALLSQEHPWRETIQYFDVIDSTNTRCKQLALQGAPHGTVLLAGSQTGGRGRLGRSFQSPGGMGVYMSVLLRPACPADQLMHLTCAAAVAACDALERVCGIRPGIKWTNDLVMGKRKISGILTELVHGPAGVSAVIGIGVNCGQEEADFAEDIRHMAGSLAMVTGKPADRFAVAAALMEAFEAMDRSLLTGREDMMARYRRDCITLGQEISLVRADRVLHARALDVAEDGALIVEYPDGHREAVSSGEVSVRGMYGYIS